MPGTIEFPIERLTVDERLELIARLWDSLQAPGIAPPVPGWHREVVRARVAAADANPGSGLSLEELRP